VALITLIIGILIGFPPVALCVLTGFTAALARRLPTWGLI
jgi:hypothetical protein